MTIKEYILSKSVSSVITDTNIKGMLLKVSTIDDCLIDPDNFDSESLEIDEEVTEVLTVKGQELLVAQMYYILASTAGNSKTVKMGNVSIADNISISEDVRASYKEMADDIYIDWDEKVPDNDFVGFRSCESVCYH